MTPTTVPDRPVAIDCRDFQNDRPCCWHKREAALCLCAHYAPIHERVLIIKLDAMGDVLRTTCLLPALAAAHPHAAITWLTRPESAPLLEHNPYIADVIEHGPDATVHVLSRVFDRVINLDAGTLSAGLASITRGVRKDGFLLHENGSVVPTNPAAARWLMLGVRDDLKRHNTRTYQNLMLDILGLSGAAHRYVLEVTAAERAAAREHLRALGMDLHLPVIGLNTGAGGRWPLKRWRLQGFRALIERLHESLGVQWLLLGGPDEAPGNRELAASTSAPVFDVGGDNALRHFCALVARCEAVVTGDTLALHIALALQRRVVALFGPTSAAEIDLYGLGEKLLPPLSCLSCYQTSCNLSPNCMDLISPKMVARAVARQFDAATAADTLYHADSLSRAASALPA